MSGLEPSYENIIKQELQIADLKRAYHALMAKAVEFAENTIYIMGALCPNRDELESNGHVLRARAFLASHEVREWRQQQEGL